MDSIVPLFQINIILCILLNSFSLSTLKREKNVKIHLPKKYYLPWRMGMLRLQREVPS